MHEREKVGFRPRAGQVLSTFRSGFGFGHCGQVPGARCQPQKLAPSLLVEDWKIGKIGKIKRLEDRSKSASRKSNPIFSRRHEKDSEGKVI